MFLAFFPHSLLHRAGAQHPKVKKSLIHGPGSLHVMVSLTGLKVRWVGRHDEHSVHCEACITELGPTLTTLHY